MSLPRLKMSVSKWESLDWENEPYDSMKEWDYHRPSMDDTDNYHTWALLMYCYELMLEFDDPGKVLPDMIRYTKRSNKWFIAFSIVSDISGKREKAKPFLEEMRDKIVEYFETPIEDRFKKTPLTRGQRKGVLKWQ